MIEQLVCSRCQILFRYENFASREVSTIIGQDRRFTPLPGVLSAEDANALDAQDALQPITYELSKKPLWWILELLPTTYTFQDMQGKWVTTFG